MAKRTIGDRVDCLNAIERFIGAPPETATAEQLADWLSRDELSASTKGVYHSRIKGFYEWLVRRGIRADNPMLEIKAAKRPRTRPRPCSRVQFERLIQTNDKQLKAMFLLYGLQGLREFEIAKFHSNHVDLDAGTVDVIGKGGARYTLPAHPKLLAHAKRMPLGYWFPSQRGKHIGSRTVWERMRMHMLRNRVPGTPHTLRHFYGTELLRAGANLREVQELMRHASPATTAIYTLVTMDDMRAALNRLAA